MEVLNAKFISTTRRYPVWSFLSTARWIDEVEDHGSKVRAYFYIRESLLGLGLLGTDLVGFWVEIGRNLVKSWLILMTWIMKSLEII